MSRLGKKPIIVPEKVEVSIADNVVSVKGPNGELKREMLPDIAIVLEGNEITLTPEKRTKFTQALWGTYVAHIRNMIQGVTEGFEKKLIIEGVGFRWALTGKTLEMQVGFSHSVKVEVPEGLEVIIEKNDMTVKGIDKELVGKFAAEVRAIKKPEPYKGKGIRYSDEVIRRKEGKKSA